MQPRTLELTRNPQVPTEPAHLEIRREDIHFGSDPSGDVILEFLVHNRGDAPSAATVARIQAAPFGVFVPWRPVGEIPVPSIPANGLMPLRARFAVERTRSLGSPDRVAPSRLLTAFGLHDGDGDVAGFLRSIFSLASASKGPRLPPDVFRAVGLGGVHWIGNLNVFVDDTPVERHRARALRVIPGRRNVAVFFLGAGEDSYRFTFAGNATAWSPRMLDLTGRRHLADVRDGDSIPEFEWFETEGTHLMALVCEPRAQRGERDLEVVVTQRSTGRVASVEFTLDPAAAGRGCYVVG